MTAFYTFRMIGMSFFGNESKHLKEIEQSGHHLHEVSASLWIPFAILAIATISIGVVGFVFEAEIHSLLGGYLLDSFGIGEQEHRSEVSTSEIQILPKGEKTFFGLNPIASYCVNWSIHNRSCIRFHFLYCKEGKSWDCL